MAGEWTGLARAFLGAPVYAGLLDVALLVLTLVVVLRAIKRREPFASRVPIVLVSAYMLLAAVEILNPNVPSALVGLEGFRKTAFTMVAFFAVALAGTVASVAPRRFFRIVAIGSIPAFLWATRQFLFPLPIDEQIIASSGVSPITFHSGSVLRAFSPTAGPFHLGILAAAVMIIALVEARSSSGWWMALALFAAGVLGLSLTRANIIAGLTALVLVAAFQSRMRERLRTLATATAPMAVALIAALVAVGAISFAQAGPANNSPPSVTSWAPATPKPSAANVGHVVSGITNPLADKNLEFRFSYWRTFAKAVAQQPVIGYGTSAAADGFGRQYAGSSSKLFQPHSMYFKAALELGLGGLVLLGGILAWMAVTSLRLLPSHRTVALMTGGFLAAMCIAGITAPMLDAYPINVLFWASAGWLATIGVRQVSRSGPDAEASSASPVRSDLHLD